MDKGLQDIILRIVDDDKIGNVSIFKEHGNIEIRVNGETIYLSSIWNLKCILDDGYQTTIGKAKLKKRIPYAIEIPTMPHYYVTLIASEERYTYEDALKQNHNGWEIPDIKMAEQWDANSDIIRAINDCADLFYPDYWDNKAYQDSWIKFHDDNRLAVLSVAEDEIYYTHADPPRAMHCRFVKHIE